MIYKRILYSLLIFLLLNSCVKVTDCIFYIPQDYIGSVLIIYNEKEEGVPIEYEGKKRIYHISKDGVLKTRFEKIKGLVREKYCYVDSNGSIVSFIDELEEYPILESTDIDSNKIFIIRNANFSTAHKYNYETNELEANDKTYINSFIVGSMNKNIDSLLIIREKNVDRQLFGRDPMEEWREKVKRNELLDKIEGE